MSQWPVCADLRWQRLPASIEGSASGGLVNCSIGIRSNLVTGSHWGPACTAGSRALPLWQPADIAWFQRRPAATTGRLAAALEQEARWRDSRDALPW